MFATAICRKPSATCSGDRSSPVAARMSAASSVNLLHDLVVQRLVAVGAEHGREVRGLDAAEHHVGVGDGQRAAAAVAAGPGSAPAESGPTR